MQKKIITTICFVALAGVLIWLGVWYDTQEAQKSQEAQIGEGQAAIVAQHTIMENLKITDVVVGAGAEAKKGDSVSVRYTGSLDDGTVFDASSKHGNQPFTFVLGAGQVIQGWDLGVLGMKVGGRRELVIPSELGYGARGAGGVIPPNATLHFTIDLLSVGTGTAQ